MNDLKLFSQSVKDLVSCGDLLRLNGISVKRSGFANCPLHAGDHDASLKVYGGGRGWVCYGCHKGGDVINLARYLYDISFPDAIRRLNEEFSLNLPVESDLSLSDKAKLKRQVLKQQRDLEKARQESEQLETDYLHYFGLWLYCDHRIAELTEQNRDDWSSPAVAGYLKRRRIYKMMIDRIDDRRLNQCRI